MQNLKNKVGAALLTAASLTPGLAFAAGGPDVSEISALFPIYAAAVVGLIIGFAVAKWSKRAANLVNPG